MRKIVFIFALACFTLTNCKSQAKKEGTEKKSVSENIKETSFKISGMTCELGCAKIITSKLSKKEGVIDAKVIFADSLATVKYDASKIDKTKIASFIEEIADGKTYKAKANCKTKKTTCNKTKKKCDSLKVDCKKKKECTKTETKCDSIKKKKVKKCNKTKAKCDNNKKASCKKKEKKCNKAKCDSNKKKDAKPCKPCTKTCCT